LSPEILDKMHAPPVDAPEKQEHLIATVDTLKQYDAFLFGIPTRFGNMPAQLKVNHRRIF
jgi:NAD(P)H dehydrogenase (quinone)